MKATIYSITGTKAGDVKLPAQFSEPVRYDLIKRAALAVRSHNYQPYGSDPEAGKKYSSKLSRRRRAYRGGYGIGISRVPRKIMSSRGTRFNWQAATVSNTVGGRQAHPPKVEKKLREKINKKERRKAIRSALAASVDKDAVESRGHKVKDYPIVVEDKAETLSKTKDVIDMLLKLGLSQELDRAAQTTARAGKSRLRGRRKKTRVGPLFVVSKKDKLFDSASNIPGVTVCLVEDLNADVLAPGTQPGRLTIYTKSSIEKLDNQQLFTDAPKIVVVKPASKTKKKTSRKKAKKPSKSKKSATKKSSKKKSSKKKTTSSKKKSSKSSSKKTQAKGDKK